MRRFWKLENWPQCKGYSLCKMVSFGQKIKLPKTCEKRFFKHITDVLCKKQLQKTINIPEMRRFWKLEKWAQCKGCSLCKMVSLGQKIKLPKTCKNLSTSTLQTFYAKNSSKKQLIFEKWDDFENWKNRDNAKVIAFEKWSIWVKK